MGKIGRLFLIKTRLEAWAIIYAITLGAVYRGIWYLDRYPGAAGWLLFVASTLVVFMVGGFILDHIPPSHSGRRPKMKKYGWKGRSSES
jgi:hypothetical protein